MGAKNNAIIRCKFNTSHGSKFLAIDGYLVHTLSSGWLENYRAIRCCLEVSVIWLDTNAS